MKAEKARLWWTALSQLDDVGTKLRSAREDPNNRVWPPNHSLSDWPTIGE
jgi:hypothetical protein